VQERHIQLCDTISVELYVNPSSYRTSSRREIADGERQRERERVKGGEKEKERERKEKGSDR
jgi:hypothetical protein